MDARSVNSSKEGSLNKLSDCWLALLHLKTISEVINPNQCLTFGDTTGDTPSRFDRVIFIPPASSASVSLVPVNAGRPILRNITIKENSSSKSRALPLFCRPSETMLGEINITRSTFSLQMKPMNEIEYHVNPWIRYELLSYSETIIASGKEILVPVEVENARITAPFRKMIGGKFDMPPFLRCLVKLAPYSSDSIFADGNSNLVFSILPNTPIDPEADNDIPLYLP